MRGRRAAASALPVAGVIVALLPVTGAGDGAGAAAGCAVGVIVISAAALLLPVPGLRWSVLGLVPGLVPGPAVAAAVAVSGRGGVPRGVALLDVLLAVVLVLVRQRQRSAAGDLARATGRLNEAHERLDVVHEDLIRCAGEDALTGLPNQDRFLTRARVAVTEARASGRHVAVLFFDLDRFKVVNDSRGHAVGDQLLRAVSARAQEVVGVGDLVARQGGDQFAVLLPEVASVQEATSVAMRLRGALQEPFDVEGELVHTSASIGIAFDEQGGDTPEDLMRHADVALYRAKDQGGNRIQTFDESQRVSVRRRLSDETELRLAVEAGQIVPYLQPVVDLRTGELVGAEALARWEHPERGLLLPVAFFPIAVEAGSSGLLGASLARQAIEIRRDLASLVPEEFEVGINVSPKTQTLEAIIASIAAMAEDIGTAPSGLTVEITEAAVVTGLDVSAAALSRGRALGFKIALDDFGTGYSALSLVRDLPLDILKIDRTFVRGMSHNPGDSAVVACMLDLARRMGLRVIAEGVEDDADAGRLLAEGAVHAQGFWYSRAVPVHDFRTWLESGVPWAGRPLPRVPSARS
jgi:diguanylate cyclase (GGDEF)-like protein